MKYLLLFTLLFYMSAGAAEKPKVIKPVNSKSKLSIIVSDNIRDYYPLSAKSPSVITVKGPGKLKVSTRSRFTSEEQVKLNYSVSYKLDGASPVEKKITASRSQKAVYKDPKLGVPAAEEFLEIKIGEGEHSLEFFAKGNKQEIAARYFFTPAKEKKLSWITLTPDEPNLPVNLITKEEVINYYRFSASEPMKIKISGPTRIKIMTRIENHYNMKGRISYRLQIKEDGKIKNSYQFSSTRSETVSYQNDPSKVPGKAKEIIIDVPGGTHVYEISPLDKDKGTILGKVLFPKKDVKIGHK